MLVTIATSRDFFILMCDSYVSRLFVPYTYFDLELQIGECYTCKGDADSICFVYKLEVAGLDAHVSFKYISFSFV